MSVEIRGLRRTYLLLARKLRQRVDYSHSGWNAYATGASVYRRVARDLRHADPINVNDSRRLDAERWDCGCPFNGEHGPDCALALPADESPWKTASRELWDADHGAGDFDQKVAQAREEDETQRTRATCQHDWAGPRSRFWHPVLGLGRVFVCDKCGALRDAQPDEEYTHA